MRTGARRRTGSSVLAVVSALVNLTPLTTVAGGAAALGLTASVQETAASIQTLNITRRG